MDTGINVYFRSATGKYVTARLYTLITIPAFFVYVFININVYHYYLSMRVTFSKLLAAIHTDCPNQNFWCHDSNYIEGAIQ